MMSRGQNHMAGTGGSTLFSPRIRRLSNKVRQMMNPNRLNDTMRKKGFFRENMNPKGAAIKRKRRGRRGRASL
jgi:hypothetical protein